MEGLLGRLDGVISGQRRPDLIFIMSGINNIAMDDYDIIGKYREILSALRVALKGTVVVVQSVLPVKLPWVDNGRITMTNSLLREAAEEFQALFLDLFPLFVDPAGNPVNEYLLDDGVHLSTAGYETWANAVERFLASV